MSASVSRSPTRYPPSAGHDLLQIVEDRRQFVELRLLGRFMVAGPPMKRGATIRLKKILAPHDDQDRVGEFLEPDRLAAQLRVARDQRRLGMLGFEVMDDRARIRRA